MSSTKGTGTPHVAAETGRIRPAVERHSRRKIVVRLVVRKLCFGVFSTTFCRSRRRHQFEDLPNCASPAFGSDNYAGVEDHSRAGGSHGLRFLMISSTSAAKPESIDDDLCQLALGPSHWQSRWRMNHSNKDGKHLGGE